MLPHPTPRLALGVLLGIIPAIAALESDAARVLVGAWNLLLAAGFVVDALSARRFETPRATRQVGGHLTHGRAAEVRLSISAARAARVVLIDEPPPSLVRAEVVETPLPLALHPGVAAEATYTVVPRRRGAFRFGALNVLLRGPLGLAERRLVLEPEGDAWVHVYPDLGVVDRQLLDPELMMAELGLKRVRKRSEGTELESLRDAVPEDELKRIDWRATARRGRLTARNYELEKNHEVLLCIDTGRLMGALMSPAEQSEAAVVVTKLDRAIQTALLLAAVALKNGDRVGLMSFADEVGAFVRPDRGRAQLGRLLEAVYALEASPNEPSFVRALGELRRRQRRRALVVVLTDFADSETATLMLDVLGIVARRHLVLFVALRDPHLQAVADAAPADLPSTYRGLAAMGLAEGRAVLVEGLSARGVRALDLSPEAATPGAIQAYLALRAAARF